MIKKQKLAKQWKSRTCKTCKKRFHSSDKRAIHERTQHVPLVNLMSSSMEYSKDQHILDLQKQVGTEKTRRIWAIDCAISLIAELLKKL